MLAAGFIVYAIGEGLVQLVCAMPPDSSSPYFAAGTALWAIPLPTTLSDAALSLQRDHEIGDTL